MSNIINSRSNQIPYNIYVEQVVENLNNHLINCTIYYSLDMKCLKIYFERFDWDARIDTKILESSYYYEVPPIICAEEIVAYVKREWISTFNNYML